MLLREILESVRKDIEVIRFRLAETVAVVSFNEQSGR